MSTYNNDTKIYQDLNPSARQEPQTHRLKKLTEIEAFFLDEIEVREWISKKMKRFNTITGIVDTCLITSTRKKRWQEKLFMENRKQLRYPGCQCHLKYESPPPYSMQFYGL